MIKVWKIAYLLTNITLIVAVNVGRTNFQQLSNGIAQISPELNFTGVSFNWLVGQKGYVYYGIRYGQAARFEHAVLNTDFAYLSDANFPKNGFICPQTASNIPGVKRVFLMSEDCLFLDVYVPAINENQELFPVLFWIYGGGFMNGYKDLYNSTSMASDIRTIVVTINYRLGDLGFLSSGDEAVRGNWAIGDIKTALEWTRRNIEHFGGNPERITIFGQSAGGVLVSALFLDDTVRANIHAAIALSGSFVSRWSDGTNNSRQDFLDRAKFLGCQNESSALIISCLKQIPFTEFNKRGNASTLPRLGIVVSPVIDGIHIKGQPLEIIPKQTTGSAVFVSGYLREDVSFLFFMANRKVLVPGAMNYTVARNSISYFVPGSFDCPQELDTILSKILTFYNITESDDENITKQKLFHAGTQALFGYPSVKESSAYASRLFSNEVPNYHYLIQYDPGFQELGAFHTLDTMLLFGNSFISNLTINPEVSGSFRNFIRQIAYNGKENFTPFGRSGNYGILNQEGRWVESSNYSSGFVKLWDEVSAFRCAENKV